MKNSTYVFVGLVFLLLASCASFPIPSEETPSILIIDRELDRGSGDLSLYVNYNLVLDNGTEHMVYLVPSDNYLIVDDLPPGNYSVTELKAVNTSTGNLSTYPLNLEPNVILAKGEITVFPYTFYVGMEKTGSHSYMQVWDLNVLSAEKKSALLRDINEKYPEEAALWEPLRSGKY